MRSNLRLLVLPIAAVSLLAAACTGGSQSVPPAAENAPAAQPEAATPAPATPPPAEHAATPPAPAPRSAPKAPAAPEPSAPAPKPEPVVKTVPAGTELQIELAEGASSKTSQVGDGVRGRLTADVSIDGMTVLPAGSTVTGQVVEAVPLKKIGGQAKLGIEFQRIDLPSGESVSISAPYAQAGESQSGKDAAKIGGGAAAGALLGRVLSKHDKSKGTAIGAIVGAAAGTAAAAKTGQDNDVNLPEGTVLAVALAGATEVTVRR